MNRGRPLRLLIVDDEVLVREGLATTVDWLAIGYEVVGTAEDGVSALQQVRARAPDVVLTDIRMPVMGGLELIDVLRDEFPLVRVVVLSCYTDFEFVREAMQHGGAVDYIPKLSMGIEELSAVMLRVGQTVGNAAERSEDPHLHDMPNERSRETLLPRPDEYAPMPRTSLRSDEPLAEFLLGLDLVPESFRQLRFLYLKVDPADAANPRSRWPLGDRDPFAAVMAVLDGGACEARIVATTPTEAMLFYVLPSGEDPRSEAVAEFWRRTIARLNRDQPVILSIGMPSDGDVQLLEPTARMGRLAEAGKDLVLMRTYTGPGTVNVGTFEVSRTAIDLLGDRKIDLLRSALEAADDRAAAEVVASVLTGFLDARARPISHLLRACQEMLFACRQALDSLHPSAQFSLDVDNLLEARIENCITVSQLQWWFEGYTRRVVAVIRRSREEAFGPAVSRAIEYVLSHLGENTSLNAVASATGVSEAYLSRLFRRVTGLNYSAYVNRIRARKAAGLLHRSGDTVANIARAVGYENVGYFNRVFRRFYQMTPTEYRHRAPEAAAHERPPIRSK